MAKDLNIPQLPDFIAMAHHQLLDLGPDEKTQFLLENTLIKIDEGNEQNTWLLQHSSFINQLLIHANHSDSQDIKEKAMQLQDRYLQIPEISAVVSVLSKSHLYDKEAHYIWMLSEAQALVINEDFYNRNIRKIPDIEKKDYEGKSADWAKFLLLQKNEHNEFTIQPEKETGDLLSIFTSLPLFLNAYKEAAVNKKLNRFFEDLAHDAQLNVDLSFLKEAFLHKNYYSNAKKLTDNQIDKLEQLLSIFSASPELNSKHFTKLIQSLDLAAASKDEQAAVLLVLSFIFMKLSSTAFFGKEDASIEILNDCTISLLKKAESLAADIMQMTGYFEILSTNACTNNLVLIMESAIKTSSNPMIKKAFNDLVPEAWK